MSGPDRPPPADVAPIFPAADRLADLAGVYLTPAQVGAMLQISAKSVSRLAASNPTMPAIRLGGGRQDKRGREITGSLRSPRERLLAWLRSREQGGGRPRRFMVVKDEAR